jgi:hypothetical protein
MKTEQAKTKPAAEVRFGNIRAAIWRNEAESGPWYNVTIERSYRDGSDYKSSSSFGRDAPREEHRSEHANGARSSV